MKIDRALIDKTYTIYSAPRQKTGEVVPEIDLDEIKLDLNSSREPELKSYKLKNNTLNHVDKSLIDLDSIPGRSLGDSIVHEYYNIPEINSELHKLLDDKEDSLKQATFKIISDIHSREEDFTPQEREELKQSALSQARYMAANFMNEEQGTAYIKAIEDILSVADMSRYGMKLVGYTSLEKGGSAVHSPVAAPEGYVSAGTVYKMFMTQDMYERYQNKILNHVADPELDAYMRTLTDNMAAYQKKAYDTLTNNLIAKA